MGYWSEPILGHTPFGSSLLISINEVTGTRVPGVIIVLAPTLALLWLMLQQKGAGRVGKVGLRTKEFVLADLPNMRSELQILMLSGFVGNMAGKFAAPLVAGSGISPHAMSPIIVLLVLVWITSILGQFAVHPLLTASMLLPMLPSAAQMHISPVVLATATLAGWVLASISTPFTATVLLISRFAQTQAHVVARIWNGPYALVCGVVFSIWIVLLHLYVSGAL